MAFRASILALRDRATEARTFDSPSDLLQNLGGLSDGPGCLVLDVPLPECLEIEAELRRRESTMPLVVVIRGDDLSLFLPAMRIGMDLLIEPVAPERLVERVLYALQADFARLPGKRRQTETRRRLQELSTREREVMNLLVQGRSSKEIGAELAIGVQTVLKHRAQVLRKLGLRNDVELALAIREFREWRPRGALDPSAPEPWADDQERNAGPSAAAGTNGLRTAG